MSQSHNIRVNRSARVYTHGKWSDTTEKIWLVAHGYGQLAAYFIKHFEVLDPNKHFVIAPEALSRAYLDGMTGRVGASWMTSEMREEEIGDYLAYLSAVIEEIVPQNYLDHCDLIGFGFSQGAATISRWVHQNNYKCTAMVLWGGAPAKELFSVNSFCNLKIVFAIGSEDAYIKASGLKRLKEQVKEIGWSSEFHTYQGGHHLSSELISSLGEKL